MKMDTFLVTLKVKKNDNDRTEFIKSHIVDKYVPLEEKQVYAQNIIKASYYRKREEDDTEEFYVNSVAKYMLTGLAMVEMYTDIELDNKNGKSLENFNKLNEARVLDDILILINDKEWSEFVSILDMVEKDTYQNEYELHGFIKNQVERFGNLAGTALLPFLENLDLAQLDEFIKQNVK